MNDMYFAGLFDGEGCVLIDKYFSVRPDKTSYRRYQLKAALGMTHYPTVERLLQTYGGSISRNTSAYNRSPEKNKMQYNWFVWSDIALNFFERIEPYSITKKPEITLAIEFQRHVKEVNPLFRRHKGKPPNYDAIYEYRDDIREKIAQHKRLNYDVSSEQLRLTRVSFNGPMQTAD